MKMKVILKENDIFNTNKSGRIKIIKYVDRKNVIIKFVDTGYTKTTTELNIKRGSIKDPYSPRTAGIGFNGVGKYTYNNSTDSYKCWERMLNRVYVNLTRTYIDCTVCKHWHNFQNFCEWFYSKESNYRKGYHLDKDLYIDGNKEYGPLTCIFIPQWLNSIIGFGRRKEHKKDTGVFISNSGSYYAQCSTKMKKISGISRPLKSQAKKDYLEIKYNYLLNEAILEVDFPDKLIWSIYLFANKLKTMKNDEKEI